MPARRNKTFRRILFFGAFAFFSYLNVSSVLAGSSSGDSFVTPSLAEPSNLIPFLASDSASAEVSRFIFNGLLKYDQNLNLAGDLAERWEVSGDSLTIRFYLRRGVLWQDGVLFSSKDVVFTYQKIMDPETASPYSGQFEWVASVTAVDDFTVEVKYKEPFSPGLSSWVVGIIPEHLLTGKNLRSDPFLKNPTGTGPYYLKKWVPGEKIELWRNVTYFEGAPNLDRVVFRVMPDPATVFLELQTQGLDSASLTPLQYNRQINTPFFRKNYRAYQWTGAQYSYLGYNLNNFLFQDRQTRIALAMAVNLNEIIRGVSLGHGRPCTGPFLPESWAFNADVKQFIYNPDQAKRMLAEAGWRDSNGDSILEKNGVRFSFTVLTNSGSDQRKMVCELLQKQFAEVGVEMRIQVLEWSVLLKEFIHPRRFEAVLMGWSLPLDPDSYDLFHSSRTAPGQFNFVSYKNPEVDGLLERARKIFDQNKRGVLYKQIHELIYQDQPYLFLYSSQELAVLHQRFEGITEAKTGIGFNFKNWYVPVSRQKYIFRLKDA